MNSTSPEIKCISWLSSDYSRLSVILNSEFARKERIGFTKIRNGNFRLPIDLFKMVFKNRRKNVIYFVSGPCQLIVIYLRFLTMNRIVIDAGWPLSDSIQESSKYVRRIKNNVIDFISMQMAQLTICESKEQLRHINKKFRVNSKKLVVGYTGINENEFISPEQQPIELKHFDLRKKRNVALFRGKINPDAGIWKILELVKLCPNIIFIICSPNFIPSKEKYSNLVTVNRTISAAEMQYLYSISSLALGQFGDYPRLKRTIPHKAFEAAFFGLPYLSIDRPALKELFPDEQHALLTDKTSEQELASYLNQVISDVDLLKKVSQNSNINYKSKFNQEYLARGRYFQIINKLLT
jgi:hypothetical protein